MSIIESIGCRTVPDRVLFHGIKRSDIARSRTFRSGLLGANYGLEADFGFGSPAEVGDRAGRVGSWRTSGRNSTKSGHSMMAGPISLHGPGRPSAIPDGVRSVKGSV